MSACRSCAAPLLWVEMIETSKRMPVDLTPVQPDSFEGMIGLIAVGQPFEKALVVSQYSTISELRGRKLHTSHFATCPHAAMHRRRRAAQGQLA